MTEGKRTYLPAAWTPKKRPARMGHKTRRSGALLEAHGGTDADPLPVAPASSPGVPAAPVPAPASTGVPAAPVPAPASTSLPFSLDPREGHLSGTPPSTSVCAGVDLTKIAFGCRRRNSPVLRQKVTVAVGHPQPSTLGESARPEGLKARPEDRNAVGNLANLELLTGSKNPHIRKRKPRFLNAEQPSNMANNSKLTTMKDILPSTCATSQNHTEFV
ncbi:MAG: hypothetical protein LBS59_01955, partial [Puniceicoccales bacterium]|nr:hypothetical protein [Puniceicoccales bacterium]